jgi:hypothetical protein
MELFQEIVISVNHKLGLKFSPLNTGSSMAPMMVPELPS